MAADVFLAGFASGFLIGCIFIAGIIGLMKNRDTDGDQFAIDDTTQPEQEQP